MNNFDNRPKAVVLLKKQPVYFVLYIMAKKDKKVNAWQIIVAVFQALAALFGSLKKSHDSAKQSLTWPKQSLRQKIPKVTNKFCCR